MSKNNWDTSYDVVIVGSGAGGLTAGITAQLHGLSSLVIEKTDKYGGSTALSGGAIWVPNNMYLKEAGQQDTLENARTYLNSTVGDRVPEEMKDAYLTQAPEMVEFLHRKTKHIRFKYIPGYSDYYPELAGGFPQGRSVESLVFDLRKLGSEMQNIRPTTMGTHGFTLTAYDFHKLNMIKRTWAGKFASLKVGTRLVRAKLTGAKFSSLGLALIGRLRLALMEAKGELWLSTVFKDFVVENDQVVGIIAVQNGKEVRIEAKGGVILASGGFSHSQKYRDQYLPSPTKAEWTSSSPEQTGDVIEPALRLGATLDLMERVWGAPSIKFPGEKPYFLVAERGIPGMIIVNNQGERYLNEAIPYHEFVDKMYTNNKSDTSTVPSWIILDQRSKNNYIFMGQFPGQAFPQKLIDNGSVKVGSTIKELAEKMGVPVNKLTATVSRFNQFAGNGKDLDFHRGESAYDKYYGDPTYKNPNLAPLELAPYYALQVYPGDIGTKGGLVTDPLACVKREDGSLIKGLFATGNCAASVMGETYPGPGATIGPSMAFGYVAAKHIADKMGK